MERPPLKTMAYKATAEEVQRWYSLMFTTRLLEERASKYIRLGKGWSYLARCAGHEGIQVALGLAFRAHKDFLFPYYRDMGTTLAAGLTPLEIVLNGLSKATDVCAGGRHMSNHFGKPAMGIQNVSSFTGNHSLHAAGVARAIKTYGSDAVALCSQGESSTSEGFVFEAFNGASREMLPVIFVVQANGYGISVPTSQQTANPVVVNNFSGLKNLLILTCDGTDVFDSMRAMKQALEHVHAGNGPVLLQANCVRMGAHSNSDAQELYRSPQELKEAERQDPLARLKEAALSLGLMDDATRVAIENAATAAVDQACAEGEAAPDPDPSTVDRFVLPDPWIPPPVSRTAVAGNSEKLREAINRTLIEEFHHNPHTYLWGQDVASKDKGGVFNVTKGMLQLFGPTRVFNAPIAEDFIVGTANGMCRFDPRIVTVVEAAQFADYLWPAMEQVMEASHEYWRTNGQYAPNMVCRLASGGYIGGGPYHSQNMEAVLSKMPGLRVMVPAFADDAAGLLRTAMRSRGVSFFLEPKYLYNRPEARGPNMGSQWAIELGKARLRREGQDVSVITYGNAVHLALDAAARLQQDHGIRVEVLDLRCLVPLDEEAIATTVRKTGRVLVAHEDHLFGGMAGEIAASIAEHHFQWLDAPVKRLGSHNTPVPFSRILENGTLLQSQQIYNAVLELARF